MPPLFPYVKKETQKFLMLGTASTAPADMGLNLDDKG
jgi:hypothetical protein